VLCEPKDESMMNVLIVSDDDARASEVERLVRRDQQECSIRRMPGDAWRQPGNIDNVQFTDVLIAILPCVRSDALPELETLLGHARNATGMLLSDQALCTDDIVAAMRAGVRYAAAWPLNEEEFAAELHAIEKRKRSSFVRDGRVLTFLSSQGGVGTTFVATQIAHACASRLEKKVLVIDADRQYADALLFLSADLPATTLVDLATQVDRLDSALFEAGVVQLHSHLAVLPGAGDPIKAAQIQAEQLAGILRFARTHYDMVVVDAGHHIDAVVLTLLDCSTDIFTVMRQGVPDLYSGTRLTNILQELGYAADKVQTIVNQFDASGKLELNLIRETLRCKAIHAFPSDDKAARSASDDGMPLADAAPRSKLARTINRFASENFGAAEVPGKGRWFSAIGGSRPRGSRSDSRPVQYT
jgi:pilus assembly protein CpaE